MIIPITLPPRDTEQQQKPQLPAQLARLGHGEVVLLELQGALDATPPAERDGQHVGILSLGGEGDDEKPTLRVGHHLLEGKIATLPKPLAVLYRCRRPNSESAAVAEDRDMSLTDTAHPNASTSASTTWELRAVVRRKIVFSKRPMPIVALPSSGSGAGGTGTGTSTSTGGSDASPRV